MLLPALHPMKILKQAVPVPESYPPPVVESPANIFPSASCLSSFANELIPIILEPSPTNDVAVITPVTVTPSKVGSSVSVIVAPTPDAVAVKLELTKLISPTPDAEPTIKPSSLIVEPAKAPTSLAVRPVILEPSPTNDVAVIIPEVLIFLTDVISSKLVSILPTANLVPADNDVVPTPNA